MAATGPKFLTLYTSDPDAQDPMTERLRQFSADHPELLDPVTVAALRGCEEQPEDRAPVAR